MNYRTLERDAFCRCCDKIIKKNDEVVITMWSCRNRGQYIFLCVNCISEMTELIALDKQVKSREMWSKQEQYKYLREDYKNNILDHKSWREEVYEVHIDEYKKSPQ